MENQTNNPMQLERLAEAQRCLARTRKGTECQSPAVKGGKRCRMHGGKGSGAPSGNRNALKHGARSAETLAAMALIRRLTTMLDEMDATEG